MEWLLGIVVLILDIWAIVNIFGSAAPTGTKVLWILLILILPVIGFIIWFFAGPRSGAASRLRIGPAALARAAASMDPGCSICYRSAVARAKA